MRHVISALVLALIFSARAATAQQTEQLPSGMQRVPEIAAVGAAPNCLSLPNVGDILVCIAQSRTVIVPLHFYTGEYTLYPEADFGPRYDPRNYNGYGPIAADMCKRFAPQLQNPATSFTEFKSLSGGCCGYGFFVMACAGIK
jgi:hypothetical protein